MTESTTLKHKVHGLKLETALRLIRASASSRLLHGRIKVEYENGVLSGSVEIPANIVSGFEGSPAFKMFRAIVGKNNTASSDEDPKGRQIDIKA